MNSPDGYSASAEVAAVRQRRSRAERWWLALKKAPLSAWFGMIVIAGYVIVALFAPWLAPYGEAQIFPTPFGPWEEAHRFGTDQIGRDILTRLIYGARNTMGIALITTLLSFAIGGGLGLVAAINRSWLDQLLSRSVDVLMAIPSLIFALVLLSIFKPSVLSLILIIAVLDSTRVFRLTRAVAINVHRGSWPLGDPPDRRGSTRRHVHRNLEHRTDRRRTAGRNHRGAARPSRIHNRACRHRRTPGCHDQRRSGRWCAAGRMGMAQPPTPDRASRAELRRRLGNRIE